MSIRKREWTKTRTDEKTGEPVTVKAVAWQVDFVDQAGKRHRKQFAKRKDAVAWWEREGAVSVREGTHVADKDSITVAEAGDLWLRDCATPRDGNPALERATIDQYWNHVTHHIKPFIGGEKLTRLTSATVRAFEARLTEKGRSPVLVRKAVSSLGALIANAKDQGLVGRNVVHELRRNKRRHGSRKRHKKQLEVGVDIPTKDELRAIINAATGRWRPLVVTAIFTGLRASELRGLAWKDVDLKAGTIRVTQRADKYKQIGPPKSETSRRTVPLAPIVLNTLKEWKLQCPPAWPSNSVSDTCFVFPTETGKIQDLSNIRKRGLGPLQVAARLTKDKAKPKYGLHSFRHAAASLWIEQGLTPKRIQVLMGHSSITVTFDTYGHLFPSPEADAAAMAQMQARLLG